MADEILEGQWGQDWEMRDVSLKYCVKTCPLPGISPNEEFM